MSTQICCRCNKEQSLENDFAFRNKSKNIKHRRCKNCTSNLDKQNYKQNPDRRISVYKTRKDLQKRNKTFVYKYLQAHPCVDCEETDIRVLDFDHLKDKTNNISTMRASGWSLQKIQEEITKCEVVCANCHRIRTATRAGWFIG